MDRLERHRSLIDATDEQILRLLHQRMRIASRVGALKRRQGLPVVDPQREGRVLRRVAELNDLAQSPLDRSSVLCIFRSIIQASRRTQLSPRTSSPSRNAK